MPLLAVSPFLIWLIVLCYVSYICVFWLSGISVERYYRSLLPLLTVLAGGGLYALTKDVDSKKFTWSFYLVIIAGSIALCVHPPVRSHRRAQTDAGLWLGERDPDYDGFVLSHASQPVYYANMRFLPLRQPWSQAQFELLVQHDLTPKYIILEKKEEDKYPWVRSFLERHSWPIIRRWQERNLRVYEDPHFAESRTLRAVEFAREQKAALVSFYGEDAMKGNLAFCLEGRVNYNVGLYGFDYKHVGGDLYRFLFVFKPRRRLEGNWIVAFHGEVKDCALLPDDRKEFGFLNMDFEPIPSTSEWEPKAPVILTRTVSLEPGDYRLALHFARYLAEGEWERLGWALDLGWHSFECGGADSPAEMCTHP